MQQIVNSSSTPTADIGANNTDNDTIFYNFVGNFVPPEWFDRILAAKLHNFI
ncbi:hypothetical protein [Candidatus Tisiphia endosymbiont of Mystacides longicornis]|uniref:hypothetical protein n=1 Tax=Candidatus Tisiphia endosymbiont of Mystacides longicornis TaxID=3139330 RepID=UPI003CCA9634